MKIYIASSWKNQHAVEMLTDLLREQGHEVLSFVENGKALELSTPLEDWVYSPEGLKKFKFDVESATKSDMVIYIGPSGTDAWAEVGAAFGAGVPVLGLWSKGEPAGLMRRMVTWFGDHRQLLQETGYSPPARKEPSK